MRERIPGAHVQIQTDKTSISMDMQEEVDGHDAAYDPFPNTYSDPVTTDNRANAGIPCQNFV